MDIKNENNKRSFEDIDDGAGGELENKISKKIMAEKQQDCDEKLFKSVFFNQVILKTIYGHVTLYRKNKEGYYFSRDELLGDKHLNYVESLHYGGDDKLKKDDLPMYGILKEIYVSQNSTLPDNVVPNGVEVIVFSKDSEDIKVKNFIFSKLPSSIHTISNVSIIRNNFYGDYYEDEQYMNDLKADDEEDEEDEDEEDEEDEEFSQIFTIPSNNKKISFCKDEEDKEEKEFSKIFTIPSNIKKISFCKCPNISKIDEYITIPNTVRELEFDDKWNNQGHRLEKGDIPEGVVSLKMNGVFTSDINGPDILPSTIKILTITCMDDQDDIDHLFYFLPSTVENLEVTYKCKEFSSKNYLNRHNNLKSLQINLDNRPTIIKSKSIPNGITSLKINKIKCKIDIDTIPGTVTNLDLSFSKYKNGYLCKGSIPNNVTELTLNEIIEQPDILPCSLLSLTINSNSGSNANKDIGKLISLLPNSLKSISLPGSYKSDNTITFPSHIKDIKFNKNSYGVFQFN